jgi:hypothetical protein
MTKGAPWDGPSDNLDLTEEQVEVIRGRVGYLTEHCPIE